MYLVEKISNSIAAKIASQTDMDQDKKEIIAYGAYGLLQIFYSISITVVFGIIFKVLLEAILISFTISVLRKYSGGVHTNSPNRCAIMGAVISTSFGLLINSININTKALLAVIVIIILSISLLIIYRYSPVDSPNKPINKEEHRRRLRRGSFVVLGLISFCSISLLLLYYIFGIKTEKIMLSILIGTAWQAFMLTQAGHCLIHKIDNFVDLIVKRR